MRASTDASEQSAAATLHENARAILLYLKENAKNHSSSTTALKDVIGTSAANISGNHAKTLMERGWIEKTGTESSGAPRDANVYTLTPRGNKEATLLLKQEQPPMPEEERIREIRQLRERVNELEQQGGGQSDADTTGSGEVPNLRDRVDSLESKVEEQTKTLDTVYDKMSELFERVGTLEK